MACDVLCVTCDLSRVTFYMLRVTFDVRLGLKQGDIVQTEEFGLNQASQRVTFDV